MKFPKISFKNYRFFLLLAILIFALKISGCNEKPTDVGMPLMFDTVTVYPLSSTTSKIITSQRTFQIFDSLHNSGAFFIGNSGDIKTASIVRFIETFLPDSLIDIDISAIKSLKLELLPSKYAYGDLTSNFLSFKVYRMKMSKNQLWSKKSSWDSLFKLDGSSDLFEPNPIGQWSGSIPILDTNSKFSVDLTDFTLVKDWIKSKIDSVYLWGLCLVPDESSKINKLFSRFPYDKANPAPLIKMVYLNKNTNKDDTLTLYSSDYKTVIKSSAPDTTILSVQASTSIRSQLFFDISSALPHYASILKAQLELVYNPSKTVSGSLGIDTILQAGLFLSDSIWLNPNINYYASLSGTRYIFPKVVSAVEWWVRHDGKGSLVITPQGWSESKRLDKISFYGVKDADTTNRPKLIIVYSKRPY